MSAMRTFASGPTDERNAWGSTTRPSTWLKLSPSARAASAWPTGTVLMPERSASHTKAEVYRIRPRTASRKLIDSKSSAPRLTPRVWLRPSDVNRMMTVSGMFRTMFTYAVPKPRISGTGPTRMAASRVPQIREPTAESTASCTVVQNAPSRS
ncbi:hypothetical protein SCYAM73S_01261 [Streptomyces cyaneofuscatus]